MKTGRGPTRFPFLDNRLDDLLGNKPNSSPHTVDIAVFPEKNVDQLQPSTSSPENEVSNNLLSAKNVKIQYKRKRQTPATEGKIQQTKSFRVKTRVICYSLKEHGRNSTTKIKTLRKKSSNRRKKNFRPGKVASGEELLDSESLIQS